MSKCRKWAREQRSMSGSPGPDHHSHRVFFTPVERVGRCSTSTRMTLPRMIGSGLDVASGPGPSAGGAVRATPAR